LQRQFDFSDFLSGNMTHIPADFLSDADLIQQCKRGDMKSYETLYTRYSRAMFQTSLRIVAVAADAEDILQDAFMEAFTSLNKLKNAAAFGGWLKSIVIHKSINHVNRGKKNHLHIEADHADELAIHETIVQKEFQFSVDVIQSAIAQLPPKYRTVVNLHIFEKKSFEEIAVLLETPSATIRSHYFRARQKLLSMVIK
jgi:RNA polymerase sigma factor (sigma-70 family)